MNEQEQPQPDDQAKDDEANERLPDDGDDQDAARKGEADDERARDQS